MPYAGGMGASVVVFTIGAILDFAVRIQSTTVDWHTVGIILMIVGAVGFVVTLILSLMLNSGGSYRRTRRVTQDPSGTSVEERGTY